MPTYIMSKAEVSKDYQTIDLTGSVQQPRKQFVQLRESRKVSKSPLKTGQGLLQSKSTKSPNKIANPQTHNRVEVKEVEKGLIEKSKLKRTNVSARALPVQDKVKVVKRPVFVIDVSEQKMTAAQIMSPKHILNNYATNRIGEAKPQQITTVICSSSKTVMRSSTATKERGSAKTARQSFNTSPRLSSSGTRRTLDGESKGSKSSSKKSEVQTNCVIS